MSEQKRKWLEGVCSERHNKRRRIRGKQPDLFRQLQIEHMPAVVKSARGQAAMPKEPVAVAGQKRKLQQSKLSRSLWLAGITQSHPEPKEP